MKNVLNYTDADSSLAVQEPRDEPLLLPDPRYVEGEILTGQMIFLRYGLCHFQEFNVKKLAFGALGILNCEVLRKLFPIEVSGLYKHASERSIKPCNVWGFDSVSNYWRFTHEGDGQNCDTICAVVLQERTHVQANSFGGECCFFSAKSIFGEQRTIYPAIDRFNLKPTQGDFVFIHRNVITEVIPV